jgi:hypothetical protein
MIDLFYFAVIAQCNRGGNEHIFYTRDGDMKVLVHQELLSGKWG